MSEKIVFWDIETSTMTVRTFSLYPEKINHSDIIQDWYIICACWVEGDNKSIKSVSVLDDPKRFKKDPRDDYYVVKKMHDVMTEADTIVAHNGDKFDWKKLNARVVYHKLPPLPPITKIDTLKVAREFQFSSKALDYLGKHLGTGGKIHTSTGLWERCEIGDKKALKEMVKYNKQDVIALRNLYKRLAPYTNKVSVSTIGRCTNSDCNSTHLIKQGFRKGKVNTFQKWQCQDCGRWCQSRLPLKLEKPTIV